MVRLFPLTPNQVLKLSECSLPIKVFGKLVLDFPDSKLCYFDNKLVKCGLIHIDN
jgi:hypothetical protein